MFRILSPTNPADVPFDSDLPVTSLNPQHKSSHRRLNMFEAISDRGENLDAMQHTQKISQIKTDARVVLKFPGGGFRVTTMKLPLGDERATAAKIVRRAGARGVESAEIVVYSVTMRRGQGCLTENKSMMYFDSESAERREKMK